MVICEFTDAWTSWTSTGFSISTLNMLVRDYQLYTPAEPYLESLDNIAILGYQIAENIRHSVHLWAS